jgi:ATP/maltotriose-dependent transcriptional regulator MalT
MVIATQASATIPTIAPTTPSNPAINLETLKFPPGLIDSLINGVLILTVQRELIYANDAAWRVLRQLTSVKSRENQVPQEIWHICQYLIHSRQMFPRQHWFMESEISTDETTALHIRARWFQVETIADPCLLLMLEDRYEVLKTWAIEEAKRYGLTPREKEAWLLHRSNYTYKEIARELRITPNTVKKHMQSIHAKQKDAFVNKGEK